MMPDRPRGACPVCNREFQLKNDGTLRVHNHVRTDWYAPAACSGSGQKPKEA